jgi:large subunit ribosomal protein L9
MPSTIPVILQSKNVNRLEHERKAIASRNAKLAVAAKEAATKIEAVSLKLARKVGEENKLFGSVTAKEIEAALAAQGVVIDRRKMQLAEPIKALGTYEVPVKLGFDVVATLKVEVVAR